MSADPLTVHLLGADPNVYAYVSGRALKAVDPLGLQEALPDEVAQGMANSSGLEVRNGLQTHVPNMTVTSGQGDDPLPMPGDINASSPGWRSFLDATTTSGNPYASAAPSVTYESIPEGAMEKGFANGIVRSFPPLALLEMSGPDAQPTRVFNDIPESYDLLGMAVGGVAWGAAGEAALGRMTLTQPSLLRGPASGARVVSPPKPGQVMLGGRDNPMGAMVFEGHGTTVPGSFTVPEGTWLRLPAPGILDEGVAQAAAMRGTFPPGFGRMIPPGGSAPNLVLHPPTPNMFVRPSSTIVNRPTLLQDMLEPNMGVCVWGACR